MKANRRSTFTAIAIAAVGVLFFAVSRSAPAELSYPFQRVKLFFTRRVAARISGLWRGSAAMAENRSLRREIDALAMDRAEYARVLAENDRLRKALDFAEAHPGRWVAAEVLSHGGGAAGVMDVIRVSKGSLAGVRVGAVVETPAGLVGRVASVSLHTSEVLLVTDPALRVSCFIAGQQQTHGILSGGGPDSLTIRHLRSAAGVSPGAKVYTSGLGGVFPGGIEVGTFMSVRRRGDSPEGNGAAGLESEGEVRPSVDFEALEDVFIRR